MTAALNQDFVTYKTDNISPIFTVQTAGVAINISTVSEIVWYCQLNNDGAQLIIKKKSTGGVQFVTDGSNGQFKVNILASDLTNLDGWYIHKAQITDAGGNPTTIEAGRMQVGPRPDWTYNAAQIAANPLYQLRLLIGDTVQNDKQLLDEEINYLLTLWNNNIFLAAAQCARGLQAKFARLVDVVQGEMKTNYSNKSKMYALMAVQLQSQGQNRGGATKAYAGGISVADKTTQVENADRVAPQFNLGMDDNLLPVGQSGNQVPVMPQPSINGQT